VDAARRLCPLEPPRVAEVKRLYVVPAARDRGLGVRLAAAALDAARVAGYARVRLDTLASMQAAQRLYERLGFRDIVAYRHNPHEARYLELDLSPVASGPSTPWAGLRTEGRP